MPLSLYNTLTRRLDPFEPLVPGRVSLYTCGPTVWNYAHIGNFRTFLFEDLLRRWLEASGYNVFHIMNLTDVDDRIIKESLKQGKAIDRLVAPFVTAFYEDRDYLRIRPAHEYPRATEFVGPMIELVKVLLANGTAYQGDDGSVYYSIATFPSYGRLSQLDRRELKAGASGRVSSDEYDKANARDFVLWKAVRPEDEQVGAAWDAPFGRGRPGWHLECSAMALALLRKHGMGDVLDIHAGGVDLIFPHHEDEIAQSCAYTGKEQFARYWLHGEFLNVRGTKMSKRFGNITTPRDLREDGVDAGAIRLLFYQTHYRQKLDLTDEALAAAGEGSRRLGEFDARLREARAPAAAHGGLPVDFDGWAKDLEGGVREALDDDLDGPKALACVFAAVKAGNRFLDEGQRPSADSHVQTWSRVLEIFDVFPGRARVIRGGGQVAVGPITVSGSGAQLLETPPGDAEGAREWARQWADLRRSARANRDYVEADRIRKLLQDAGWEVRDVKDGTWEIRQVEP